MTASCPGDVRAAARGRSGRYWVCQSKACFFLWTYKRPVEPGRTLMGSGSEEDCWRNAAAPEQSECGWGEAFRGPQAGVAGQGKGGTQG